MKSLVISVVVLLALITFIQAYTHESANPLETARNAALVRGQDFR